MAISENTAWFSIEQRAGLEDFWRVYDANFDAITDEYDRAAPNRPSPARAEARDRLRRAVGGDWAQYSDYLRAQAAGLARQGTSFSTWHDLAAAFTRLVAPLLIREYHDAPDRLIAAILAMHQFGQRGIATLGDAYIEALSEIARERQAHAEAARQVAEARFTRLAEVGILGVVVVRLDPLRVLEVNDTVPAMLGYTRDELLSGAVPWATLALPEWEHVDQKALGQLAATGVGALREKEYLHKDGHRVPVLIGSATLEGTEGDVISFILDVTEQKRADAVADHLRAVHAADVVFRTMIDSVTDYAIFMLDLEGRVATWNPGVQRLKGYGADEIVGKHFSVFYTAEDIEHGIPAAELRTAIAEGRSELEGWRVRRDGSRFWAKVVVNAMRGPDGEMVGFSKVTQDLTARKAAETALSVANHELEAFSYSVAHDLRAPLRGMNGFAQLLLNSYGDRFDAEGKEWLGEIVLNARKMAALIDALLSLAKVSRSRLNPEPVDLSTLASDATRRLLAAEPDRHVRVVIEPGLVPAMDPQLARALVENLIGNAWKFTSHAPEACIEVGRTGDPGAPTFFVRDNGAGFDMTYADKLFGAFQRLHSVTEFPGTGIGLATVQRIVHRHGGRVWAEGAVGRGATFSFTLWSDGRGGAS